MSTTRVAPTTTTDNKSDDKMPNMKSEIRIADFNFDIDGDGNIDPFEKKVMLAFKAADRDNSGTLTPVEMLEIMRGMAEQHKTTKRLSRTVVGLVALVFVLIAALVGVAITGAVVGGEMIKESKVPDCSDPTDSRCDAANIVTTGQVESFIESFFDLPRVPTNQLAYVRDITMYIDMTSDASVGGAVEATYKLAGAYKRSDTTAWLDTTNGHRIEIDATARTGTIRMNGFTFPISDTAPQSAGRRLETADDAPMMELKTGKQLAQGHIERRELNMFAGALLTSGSFTMMASSAFRRELEEHDERRHLNMFAGALLTSGSFTMMASSAF